MLNARPRPDYAPLRPGFRRNLAWSIAGLVLTVGAFASGVFGLTKQPESVVTLALFAFTAGMSVFALPMGVKNILTCLNQLSELRELTRRGNQG